jgi:hypothetical protein
MSCAASTRAKLLCQKVFKIYAANSGISRIAKTLNGERVSPPRGWGWLGTSAIRKMLCRPGRVLLVCSSYLQHRGDKKVEKYLTVLCRHAVSHAGDPHNIDPDDDEKLGRLHVAATVLRELARHFIRTEMEFSEHYFDGT